MPKKIIIEAKKIVLLVKQSLHHVMSELGMPSIFALEHKYREDCQSNKEVSYH